MGIYIGGIDRARRRLPVSPPEAWTPFHLGDALLGYWDAEDSASITLSGSNVTAWADRKGGYTPTQATVANQPTWSATAMNGRPGLVFDGVDDFLELTPAPASFPIGANPSEIWVLVNQAAPGTSAGLKTAIGYGSTSAARQIARVDASGTSRARAVIGYGANSANAIDTIVDFTGNHFARAIYGPTSTSISADGASAISVIVTPNTTGIRLRIGAGAGDVIASYWSGSINCILITSSIGIDQSNQIMNYMKYRANIY